MWCGCVVFAAGKQVSREFTKREVSWSVLVVRR